MGVSTGDGTVCFVTMGGCQDGDEGMMRVQLMTDRGTLLSEDDG